MSAAESRLDHQRHGPTAAAQLSLLPRREELCALSLLAALYFGGDAVFGRASYSLVNVAGPLALCAVLGLGAWRMVEVEGANIWTALFWFRISTAIYFGLGTSAVYFANAATRQSLMSYFAFDDDGIFKLNVVVTLSAIAVLTSAYLTLAAATGKIKRQPVAIAKRRGDNSAGLIWIGLAFLAVGLAVDCAFVVPYRLKWTEQVLPGSVLTLTNLIPVGIFMTAAWSLRHARSLLPLVVGVVAVRSFTSLIMFEKATLLATLILFLLALLWRKVTLWRLIAVAAVVSATYAVVTPVVMYGRQQMAARYGDLHVASLNERWGILTSYVTEPPIEEPGEQLQSGWARISYVNQATFAISLYDSGWPGHSLSLLPAVFVPRVLWPEKPIITKIGTDFNVMATGIETSSSSPTLFGEAYWNFGWLGIPVCMGPLGIILALLSLHTAWVFREGRWIYFPTVFLALIIGFRTDGVFVADVAGASVILVSMLSVLFAVEQSSALLRPRRRRHAVPRRV